MSGTRTNPVDLTQEYDSGEENDNTERDDSGEENDDSGEENYDTERDDSGEENDDSGEEKDMDNDPVLPYYQLAFRPFNEGFTGDTMLSEYFNERFTGDTMLSEYFPLLPLVQSSLPIPTTVTMEF